MHPASTLVYEGINEQVSSHYTGGIGEGARVQDTGRTLSQLALLKNIKCFKLHIELEVNRAKTCFIEAFNLRSVMT